MRWEQPKIRDGWLRKEVVSIVLPPPPGHKSAVSLRAWRRSFWKAIRQMIEWPQASCDTNVQQSYFRGWRDPITACIIFIRALITLWHVCRICKNSHLVLYTGPQYWNGKCKSSLIVGFLRKHFKMPLFYGQALINLVIFWDVSYAFPETHFISKETGEQQGITL